jgi:hypothetical protein
VPPACGEDGPAVRLIHTFRMSFPVRLTRALTAVVIPLVLTSCSDAASTTSPVSTAASGAR